MTDERDYPNIGDLAARVARLEGQLSVPLHILRGEPMTEPYLTGDEAPPRLTAHPLESRFANVETRQGQIETNLHDLLDNYSLLQAVQRSIQDLGLRLGKVEIHLEGRKTQIEETELRLRKIERRTDPNRYRWNSFPTIDSLIEGIGRVFNCKDGHYGSHADGPNPVTKNLQADKVNQLERDRFCYRTIGYITEETEDSFPRLRCAIAEDLAGIALKLAVGQSLEVKPDLFWRFAKEARFEEDVYQPPGRGPRQCKIRTRIAIPDFEDWESIRSHHTEGPKGYHRI